MQEKSTTVPLESYMYTDISDWIQNRNNKKNHRNLLNYDDFKLFWRRERDSNPRYLAVQRFSRPPQSTTLPSLQNSI